jgi:hypothetical protein
MDELLVASGRSFAKLQGTSRPMYIISGDKEKDFTYEIIAEYADSLMAKITAKQAKSNLSIAFRQIAGRNRSCFTIINRYGK